MIFMTEWSNLSIKGSKLDEVGIFLFEVGDFLLSKNLQIQYVQQGMTL